MVKPNFTTDYLGAVFREGADELTLRAREEGVLRILSTPLMWDTKKRWKPPLVDLDWHAFCQDIFQGVEGPEWDAMYSQYEDLHQAVKSKKSGEHKKAKVLWTMIETKGEQDGSPFQIAVLGHHFLRKKKSPMAAVAKAFVGLEQGESVPPATSGEARSVGSFVCLCLGGMEGTSSDTEDGRFSSE